MLIAKLQLAVSSLQTSPPAADADVTVTGLTSDGSAS